MNTAKGDAESLPPLFESRRLDPLMDLAVTGDLERIKEIVWQFLDVDEDPLKRLEDARMSGDFFGIAKAAHALKGSAGLFGLSRAEAAAVALENAAHVADAQEVERWAAEIGPAWIAGRNELRAFWEEV